MRKILRALIVPVFVTALALAPAWAAPKHKHNHATQPAPATLPAVALADLQTILSTADKPVFVMAVAYGCHDCAKAEAALARQAKRFPGAAFFKENIEDFSLGADETPYLLVYVPGVGRTVLVARIGSRNDLPEFLATRLNFAVHEAAAAQTVRDLESQLSRATAPFSDKIDKLAQDTASCLSNLFAEEQRVKNEKAAAIKQLTAELTRLTQQRQAAAGNLPAEAAIDAQLAALQKKIDEQTSDFDDRLAQIAAAKEAAVQRFSKQHDVIAKQRDAATEQLRDALNKARQKLAELLTADRQSQ